MAQDRTEYQIDCTQLQREGRNIETLTLTDISPEMVLMQQAKVRIEGLRTKVGYQGQALAANWRRRLSNVSQT